MSLLCITAEGFAVAGRGAFKAIYEKMASDNSFREQQILLSSWSCIDLGHTTVKRFEYMASAGSFREQ
jgi:hypothetical protein